MVPQLPLALQVSQFILFKYPNMNKYKKKKQYASINDYIHNQKLVYIAPKNTSIKALKK